MPDESAPEGFEGDRDVFSTYNGIFKAVMHDGASTTSPNVLLTCVNDVQFAGDWTSADDGGIMTLPEQCRPAVTCYIPVVNITDMGVTYLTVNADGTVTGEASKALATSGISFNINSCFYKDYVVQ